MSDLRLLENFLDSFAGGLSKASKQVNRKDEPHGDTLLHYATLMDYRHKHPLAMNEALKENEYQLNFVRQRVKHEPAQSLAMKKQMVELLITKGGADPQIKNDFGVDSMQIAKLLKDKHKVYDVMQQSVVKAMMQWKPRQ